VDFWSGTDAFRPNFWTLVQKRKEMQEIQTEYGPGFDAVCNRNEHHG